MLNGIKPSSLYLPKLPDFTQKTLYDYLIFKFPNIAPDIWRQRFIEQKITNSNGKPFALDTPYQHGQTFFYYRELPPDSEPIIPFYETILYLDEHLIVVDKPHFLPVIPTGKYVKETLLTRLRLRAELAHLDVENITPIHRLDKDTAGVMLFSHNLASRSQYQRLFQDKAITKTYHAIAPKLDLKSGAFQQSLFALSLSKVRTAGSQGVAKDTLWFDTSLCYVLRSNAPHTTNESLFPFEIRSRLVRGEQFFTTQTVTGEVNAITQINKLKDFDNDSIKLSLYELNPITGKKHQLRVHLNSLGIPILNDPLYPVVRDMGEEGFTQPLQLLAKRIEFIDPISGEKRVFESEKRLILDD